MKEDTMDRFLNRRVFLQLSGMSLALTVADGAAARNLARERRRAPEPRGPQPLPMDQLSTPTLVTVFLRGGADGLNVAVPTEGGEHATYLTYRPTIGVTMAQMSAAGTLLTDASGVAQDFGLHPIAGSLRDLWNTGHLAILPDVHYDNGSRSHFDSMQFYENGTPFKKFTSDGWANRHLRTSGSGDPLLRAIAFDGSTPFAMSGPYPTLTFAGLNDLTVSGDSRRNGNFLTTQELVYPTTADGPRTFDPEVSIAGRDLVAAIRAIEAQRPLPEPAVAIDYIGNELDGSRNNLVSAPTARNYDYFGDRLKDLAKLIKTNAFTIEMAEVDLYGWDTHNVQATEQPPLIETLSRNLKAFVDDLGDAHMRNVVILVYSEFGRTSRENGNAGTDHGSATLALVIAHPSKINGRRIYSPGWHGLTDLRDDRDLKHSVDYRSLIAEAVSRHLGNSSPDIFPGFTPTPIGIFV
jgi:uncharacterized protein (DUF1501 family)